MATKSELLKEAEALGIEFAGELNYNELQKQVSAKRKELKKAEDTSGESQDTNSDDQEGTSDGSQYTNLDDQEETITHGKEAERVSFFTDENGGKWSFSKRTPEKFRFNGVIKTQAEWLKDENSMQMLVYGQCSYVEPYNK